MTQNKVNSQLQLSIPELENSLPKRSMRVIQMVNPIKSIDPEDVKNIIYTITYQGQEINLKLNSKFTIQAMKEMGIDQSYFEDKQIHQFKKKSDQDDTLSVCRYEHWQERRFQIAKLLKQK